MTAYEKDCSMKRPCVYLLAAAAFTFGLIGPAFALAYVTPWATVQENPGTNCTLGHAVINNTTVKAGSTAISVDYCNAGAPDVNLPAGRMGVAASGFDSGLNLCASTGGYVTNAASTAIVSTNATVYCSGTITGWGYQRRKINSTDWSTPVLEITDPLSGF